MESTQKSDLDITAWLGWFLDCLDRAVEGAGGTLAGVLQKARFWESLAQVTLNERQRKVLNRMLDGFEGNLTSSRWAGMTKTSPDTALRDINDLVERGVLVRGTGGGRGTGYLLVPRS